MKVLVIVLSLFLFSISQKSLAQTIENSEHIKSEAQQENIIDDLNPFDPNIEQKLEEMDKAYEGETGTSSFLKDFGLFNFSDCYRKECKVWAQVIKSEQRMYLYVDGRVEHIFDVSTGVVGYETPNFDKHPNGRIYDRYDSKKYPGGDYNGLGNMPYAVFIEGGFAIHGTGQSNWRKLGRRASHGCIRVHPDNAIIFNRLVRANGIYNVWITVQ